jgi:3-oxoacyl-[acyl-carrier protein] reductase
MDMGLHSKVALITGGSSGLGAAAALLLAQEGCRVAVNYIEGDEKARAFAEKLKKDTGSDCLAVYGDVSKEKDADRMVEETTAKLGGLDILVNNAACLKKNYLKDMPVEEWQLVLDVNLTGTFLLTQRALKYFLDHGIAGKVISVISQSAFNGTGSGHAHYSASKAGIVGMSLSLAREVAKDRILVNCVAPGIIETPMVREKIQNNKECYMRTIPVGRPAQPVEVAYAVLFLASKMGDYLTGATIDVSGGMMMR